PGRRHDAVLRAIPLGAAVRDRRSAHARARAPAVARRARAARRPVRMHPLRVLLHGVPELLVNPDKFVGPAGLLQAYRFIADSRDTATNERLDNLEDPYRLFR